MGLYQDDFSKSGAAGLNLDVDESEYEMFRSEIGIEVSKCIRKLQSKFLIDGKLVWLREERFFGANYEANFKDTDCTFKVKGLHPDQSLLSSAVTGTYITTDDNTLISLCFEVEVGKHSLIKIFPYKEYSNFNIHHKSTSLSI